MFKVSVIHLIVHVLGWCSIGRLSAFIILFDKSRVYKYTNLVI